MCSLNLVEIPKKCTSYAFQNIFEHCVKNYGMVPLGVYKRHQDEGKVVREGEDNLSSKERSSLGENARKPFMWLHPPPKLELTIHDELFVLSKKNPKESLRSEEMYGRSAFSDSSKLMRNEEKKTQKNNVEALEKLNG